MSHYERPFGYDHTQAMREECATRSVAASISSEKTMDFFRQFDGLLPMSYDAQCVQFYDASSVAELAKRMRLDINMKDVRGIKIQHDAGQLTLSVEFMSLHAKEKFENEAGAARVQDAVHDLNQRAGYPFFDEEPDSKPQPQPSTGLSFDRFVQVANEVDAMHRQTTRQPRPMRQRLDEIKERHKNWATKVEGEEQSPQKPSR